VRVYRNVYQLADGRHVVFSSPADWPSRKDADEACELLLRHWGVRRVYVLVIKPKGRLH
jgi:hypothetical protein